MTSRFSAYLQVYNDWSLLPEALASLRGVVDELVVVDGAYEWMASYLTRLGRNPERSDDALYDCVEASGIPYRRICRTWRNQLQKRMTGYQACSHNLIFRVDADEVLRFDHRALEDLLASGHRVGEMDMPLMLSPELMVAGQDRTAFPRQCFFFDREHVSPETHLNYLWLVLEADRRPTEGDLPFPVYPVPLAFNYHLTNWRRPDVHPGRVAYYVTNWMRGNGVPWLPSLADTPLSDFDHFFALVPPERFLQLLEVNGGALGKFTLEPGEVIHDLPHLPPGASISANLPALYASFEEGLSRLNTRIAGREQAFIKGQPLFLDVSTQPSRAALLTSDRLALTADAALSSATARLHLLDVTARRDKIVTLETTIVENVLDIRVPWNPNPSILRQVLELTLEIETDVVDPVRSFRLR